MVGRFWKWLTDAHRHDWETIKVEAYETWKMPKFNSEKVKTGAGTLYTLRCKTCGEIMARKVGV